MHYADSVFINCPFDDGYKSFSDAILFTVFDCGFIPRSAKEVSDSDEVRIHKLFLDSSAFRYQMFLSDIAGQDIRTHNNEVEQAIICTRNWLFEKSKRKSRIPSGKFIYERFRQFQAQLPLLCKKMN